jgi:hypothetical protein
MLTASRDSFNDEKQETKGRIQKPESRSQKKRKEREFVNVVSALSFWLLNSAFWILPFVIPLPRFLSIGYHSFLSRDESPFLKRLI